MAQITVHNLAAGFSDELFREISLTVPEGDRLGIVGNNGVGKTTLLRCIGGLVEPSEGTVTRPKGWRIGYIGSDVPQHLLGLTLREAALEAISEAERDMYGWRADMILDGFAASDVLRERSLDQLSGGWQRLALMAREWVSDPDLLLLDEPTNHLDLTKIVLLESWLNEQAPNLTLVVVSHDRRFLDTCTTRTLFLRPGHSAIYSHPFSRARALLAHDDRAALSQRQNEQRELQRLRRSAHDLRQIGVNNYSAAALRKSIQIAKRAAEIEDALPDIYVEPSRDVRLASRELHSAHVLVLSGLTIATPDGIPLFQVDSLEVRRGDRVVVLGRNGVGKTQLMQRLRRASLDLASSRDQGIYISPSAVVGYVDQNMTQLPEAEGMRTYIASLMGSGEQKAISTLVGAGFPVAQQLQRIRDLSPGEKARVALLALRIAEPSLYLMDEPTNHLDIAGQEQLEQEILDHDATAILVSHDRAFVEAVGSRFVVIEDGAVFEVASPDQFYRSLLRDRSASEP